MSSYRKFTSEEVEIAKRMWSDGASLDDLATVLGRSLRSVAGLVERNREIFAYRQRHVSDEKRYVMRMLRREGWDIRHIARYMNVSTACVHNHVCDTSYATRESNTYLWN